MHEMRINSLQLSGFNANRFPDLQHKSNGDLPF